MAEASKSSWDNLSQSPLFPKKKKKKKTKQNKTNKNKTRTGSVQDSILSNNTLNKDK